MKGLTGGKGMLKKRPSSIIEILNNSIKFLSLKGINTPHLDAEVILSHVLKKDRLNLYLEYDRPLTEVEIDEYLQLLERRGKREPVAYITGTKEFWSIPFRVSRDVLIPRPETEHLVELALIRIKAMARGNPLIMDIGTGCGAIAISIAKETNGKVRIIATDISMEALKIANLNARLNGCEGNILFVKADLFPPLKGKEVDLIVCNPPYVPSFKIPFLDPEIKNYEPIMAIDGGPDGLDYIKKIISHSTYFLKSGGELIMEIGFDQGERVIKLIEEIGCFDEKALNFDLSGKERVIWARKG
jgi:release factor glutamine methyltransferase